MIKDLSGIGSIDADVDYTIIGVGTVGVLIANELTKKGYNVLALESGGITQESETNKLNEVIYKKSKYESAKNGRFRCLGGTSSRWGGAMLPNLSKDIELGNWPISSEEMIKHLKKVEDLFKLPNDSYKNPFINFKKESNFISRLAKLPSFKNRNIFNIFNKEITKKNGPSVWINATVTKFKVNNKKLEQVIAENIDGSSITVKSKNFIFTSGAIETTRLMLLLNQQNNNCISNITNKLGSNFSDHISIPVANIKIKNKKKLNELFAYHFDINQTMKSMRLELNENCPSREIIPPFFGRVVISNTSGGYENLREIFRILQKRKIPSLKNLLELTKELPWILKAIWWRIYKKTLLFPKKPDLEMNIVIEQVSDPSNKISLSIDKNDVFKQPLAEINWSVSESDSKNIFNATYTMQEFWNTSSLSKIGDFRLKDTRKINELIKNADGIHHPSGTTRMSNDKQNGVVDNNLQLFSLENTGIISTSVFPTGGGSNPTMTLFMLAYRYIDRIKKKY